jgi:hypothetical protein
MAGFLWGSCSHYPIVLRRVYTIALYVYYPIVLYHFYLIVLCRDRTWSRPLGSAAPHLAANG